MTLDEEQNPAHLTTVPEGAGEEPVPHHGAHAPEPAAWGGPPPEHFPEPHPDAGKIRILCVFAWLVVGGAETEVRLLAQHLPRDRYRIDVLPCFRKEGMPDQSHHQLRDLGIHVDTTAYDLGFEDTVDYLRRKLADFDLVLSFQDVADIYPALERLKLRPPLIEHGGLVREALSGPKHFTMRYVGVCDSIREAAASKMPDRRHHAVEIPSMVDLGAFRPEARGPLREALGIGEDEVLLGWVGRLDRKKRVEDFIEAAAIAAAQEPKARFVVVGGPDAFMPEYERELHDRAGHLGLHGRLIFTGDRGDVPDLMAAMDGFCWLSRGEGMPHVIAEAGAAGLAVIATPDNGACQQIVEGRTGLFVPHEDPAAVAAAMLRLIRDLLAATGHDRHAAEDYRQLAGMGIRACRDGTRWHLIDRGGAYDFSSFTPMVEAARNAGTQVVWDLLHYGWPEDIDIYRPDFVHRFARYARAVAQHLRGLTDDVPFWCPVNEISFHAWAGGDARYLNPYDAGRGWELKCQLARASIAAMIELRDVDPRARFVHAEPLIAIHHVDWSGRPRWETQGFHDAQFQAFELLGGWMWPQIGGDPSFLDIVGVNYYWNNQWIHGGKTVDMDDVIYRPLSDLLFEVSARYGRPMMLAETGTEGARRGPWFDYVAGEVARARARGVPVEGVCLYPVADHPGWDDDRMCPNGLLGAKPSPRSVHEPLRAAVQRALRAHDFRKISAPPAQPPATVSGERRSVMLAGT